MAVPGRRSVVFAQRHPLLIGLITIAVVTVLGVAAAVRALELSASTGVVLPLVGVVSGIVVIALWLNGALRHDYRLTTAEWVLTLVGQGASVAAVIIVLKDIGPASIRVLSAAYLAGFTLALVPGFIVSMRRQRRKPREAATNVGHAADALLGARRRR